MSFISIHIDNTFQFKSAIEKLIAEGYCVTNKYVHAERCKTYDELKKFIDLNYSDFPYNRCSLMLGRFPCKMEWALCDYWFMDWSCSVVTVNDFLKHHRDFEPAKYKKLWNL